MATVWQSEQLAAATAALVASTVEELVWTIFRLMAMTVLPSLVLLATATLLVPWPELAAVEAAAATVVVVSGADEETSGTPPSANARPPTPITATATAAMTPVRDRKSVV